VRGLKDAFRSALTHHGVGSEQLDAAASRVESALQNVLADERGRWMLSAEHQQQTSEYALTALHGGKMVNIAMDRTFVDSDGVRWIIDYKTGGHEGGGLKEFLNREQERYRPQLERYAAIFQKMEQRPIRLGLYFPLLSEWRSWEPLL